MFGFDDAVSSEQVRKDGGGGRSVSQSVVRSGEVDAVALGNIDEAVRHLTVGVELARHAQRAELGAEFKAAAAVCCTDDEACVKLGVVRREDCSIEQRCQLVKRCREPWSASKHRAGESVNVCRPDTLERPPQSDEG